VLYLWNREPGKLLCRPVESVEELIASDPKRAIAILEERANGHPAETDFQFRQLHGNIDVKGFSEVGI
jgi:hypothetical protein